MKIGLIGKKLGMTQIFKDGIRVPVTLIEIEPNYILQVKNTENDGYDAIQVGSLKNKWYRGSKPVMMHIMKAFGMKTEDIEEEIKKKKTEKIFTFRVLKEFRLDDKAQYQVGEELDLSRLKIDDQVTITGVSKGKGFQGVMKRWNFAGGPKSHGSHFHRRTGSIGMCTSPGRVLKGKKMPGHMGNARVTIPKVKIVDVLPEKKVVLVKGSVPGAINGIVYIQQ